MELRMPRVTPRTRANAIPAPPITRKLRAAVGGVGQDDVLDTGMALGDTLTLTAPTPCT